MWCCQVRGELMCLEYRYMGLRWFIGQRDMSKYAAHMLYVCTCLHGDSLWEHFPFIVVIVAEVECLRHMPVYLSVCNPSGNRFTDDCKRRIREQLSIETLKIWFDLINILFMFEMYLPPSFSSILTYIWPGPCMCWFVKYVNIENRKIFKVFDSPL